jgi:hypothetical protein
VRVRPAWRTCSLALHLVTPIAWGRANAQLAAHVVDTAHRHAASTQWPDPKGQYPVGTTRFVWVDSSRADPTAPTPGALRQVIVQLWYPAARPQAGRAASAAPYMLEFDGLKEALARDPDLAPHVDAFATLATGAGLDAAISTASQRYPVVAFSHGLGAPRAIYTSFVMRLASAGYVVAAIDHPGMGLVALPGGRLAEPADPLGQQAPAAVRAKPEDQRYTYWLTEVLYISADQRFTLDKLTELGAAHGATQFANRLDMSRIAMIGHSRGFVSTTCAADRRIKACVNIEGDPDFPQRRAGLPQPFMTVRNPSDSFPSITAPFKAVHNPAYDIVVQDANHNSVTDLGLLGYRGAGSPDARAAAAHRLDIIVTYVTAFLDETLRGRPSAMLHATVSPYANVIATRYGLAGSY